MKTYLRFATLNVVLIFYSTIQKVTSSESTLEGSIKDILSVGNDNLEARKLIMDLIRNELKPIRDEYQRFETDRIKMNLDFSKQKDEFASETHKIMTKLNETNERLSNTIERQQKAVSDLKTEFAKELQFCTDYCQSTNISISKLGNELQTSLQENENTANPDGSLLKNETQNENAEIQITNITSLSYALDVQNTSDLEVSVLEREIETVPTTICTHEYQGVEYDEYGDPIENDIPVITSERKTYQEEISSEVRLPCHGDHLKYFVLLWHRGEVLIAVGDVVIADDKRITIENSGMDLIIRNLTASDAAVYKCSVSQSRGKCPVFIEHTLDILSTPSPQFSTSST